MVGIAAAAFLAIFSFGVPFPLIILCAGVVGYLGGRAGLPAGVQIAAPPWREDRVLALMRAIESQARTQPDFPHAPPE